jgi:hypothetical protein
MSTLRWMKYIPGVRGGAQQILVTVSVRLYHIFGVKVLPLHTGKPTQE